HADPVVKARETLARAVRAERSERNLVTLLGESRRSDVERMDQVTDALGLDRLRDWGEIVRALRAYRAASELYAETRPAAGGEKWQAAGGRRRTRSAGSAGTRKRPRRPYSGGSAPRRPSCPSSGSSGTAISSSSCGPSAPANGGRCGSTRRRP